jgi:peptidoglycan/xylan/chitin deacetylase (PgdA/CDA1 family)
MIYTKAYFVPPKIIKNLFKGIIWNSRIDKIIVTIDDSPEEKNSAIILEKLAKYDIKAVFFLRAADSLKHRSVVKEIISNGHLVANHSYSHCKLRFAEKKELQKEIFDSKSLLEDLSGTQIKYFRPPYGVFDFRVLKNIEESGQHCMMWSLLSGDHLNKCDTSKKVISKYLDKNSNIVFHDNKRTIKATCELIDETVKISKLNNYFIGEPTECLN